MAGGYGGKMFFEFNMRDEEEYTPKTSISDLSTEILVIILSYLPIEDLSRLARINSEWLLVTQDKSLWLPYCLKIGALAKKKRISEEDEDEYEDMDEVVKARCVDARVVERNWENSRYYVQSFGGHGASIRGVSFLDDLMVSASEDGTAKIWSISRGKCERTIHGHQGWIYTTQIGNGVILTGAQDRKMKLWGLNSHFITSCIHTFTGHEDSVVTAKFDNTRVVSGSRDKSIRVWDINTGQLISTLLGHIEGVLSLNLRDNEILSASLDKTAKVWDIRIGDSTADLVGHKNSVTSVKVDSKTGKIYTGSADLTIGVWDPVSYVPHFLDGHVWHVQALDIVGDKLISAASDKTVRVWDTNTEKCTNVFTGQFSHAIVAMQADQRKIVLGSFDKAVKIFHFGKPFC